MKKLMLGFRQNYFNFYNLNIFLFLIFFTIKIENNEINLSLNYAIAAKQPADIDALSALLKKKLKIKIKGVARTALAGIYEVNLGDGIIYTDIKAQYIIQGQLFDLESRTNLTELRNAQINLVNFSKLPIDTQAIKIIRDASGNISSNQNSNFSKRKIVVFADPNCGYCKKLESTLTKMKNLTIYTFLLPILSDDSKHKSRQIWCASNRAKAWQDWTLINTPPTGMGTCTNPMDKNLTLANSLGIYATPTIIFGDGSRISGAASAEEIENKL